MVEIWWDPFLFFIRRNTFQRRWEHYWACLLWTAGPVICGDGTTASGQEWFRQILYIIEVWAPFYLRFPFILYVHIVSIALLNGRSQNVWLWSWGTGHRRVESFGTGTCGTLRLESDLAYAPLIEVYFSDDIFIKTYLVATKRSLERCKEKIDSYFTVRSQAAEFFTERDPLQASIQKSLSTK